MMPEAYSLVLTLWLLHDVWARHKHVRCSSYRLKGQEREYEKYGEEIKALEKEWVSLREGGSSPLREGCSSLIEGCSSQKEGCSS